MSLLELEMCRKTFSSRTVTSFYKYSRNVGEGMVRFRKVQVVLSMWFYLGASWTTKTLLHPPTKWWILFGLFVELCSVWTVVSVSMVKNTNHARRWVVQGIKKKKRERHAQGRVGGGGWKCDSKNLEGVDSYRQIEQTEVKRQLTQMNRKVLKSYAQPSWTTDLRTVLYYCRA